MSEIVSKTILQIKEGLKKREYSALEVTDAFISASESNKKLNFYKDKITNNYIGSECVTTLHVYSRTDLVK